MTVHIGAAAGDIAETVLMPGDPLRAKWAAETFLDDVTCVNEVRGMLGFTGTWRGNRVTIHGSGMGMPSMSIYANELIRDYGAKTLIRIGSTAGSTSGSRPMSKTAKSPRSSSATSSRPMLARFVISPPARNRPSSSTG
jgi:purine-nucleoside phosphorylase